MSESAAYSSASKEEPVDDLTHYMQATSRLRAALADAVDVATWMSGSPSFSPEGEAHEGWLKQREKLYAAMAVLNGE